MFQIGAAIERGALSCVDALLILGADHGEPIDLERREIDLAQRLERSLRSHTTRLATSQLEAVNP